MTNSKELNSFITELKYLKLENLPEQAITFLEIMGCEDKEVISSNILAFFLNSEEKHQLGDLCIKTLLSLYDLKYENKSFFVKEIKTEVVTSKGKRIDIWIETEEELILIENKIYHITNNPFKEYKIAGDKRINELLRKEERKLELITILLGLEEYDESFKSITHFKFLRKLENELKFLAIDNLNDYVLFLKQYIKTMLRKDKNSEFNIMNKKSAEFMRNHLDELRKLEKIKKNTYVYYENQLKKVITRLEGVDDLGLNFRKVYHNDSMEYAGAFVYSRLTKLRKDNYVLWLAINISTINVGVCFYKNGSSKDIYKNTREKFPNLSYDEEAKEVYLLDEENTGFSDEEIAEKFIKVIRDFK